ncbi:MAG: NUDIX domain-containing protein [Fuerstiella sp.]|nr:NUDIX domain-containing protein [Fuerstiella sp.]
MDDTQEEWFDVVDEHDHVVCQKRRTEVHKARLLHRAVHIFVCRADGRLLIHRRSRSKYEFPGVWTSSASGHVSAGENYAVAAGRELTEELGITTQLHRCQKFQACPDTSMEFTVLFECRWDHEIFPDPGEIEQVKWVETDELANEIQAAAEKFSPAFRLLFHWHHQNRGK